MKLKPKLQKKQKAACTLEIPLSKPLVCRPLPSPLPRGEGIGLQAAFRVQANFHFVEAPFSDDLVEHHRHTHRPAESKFRPMAIRTRVYAANSEAAATRPLSPWERVRERAVSRKLTSKPITLPLQPRPLKAACNETKTTNHIVNHPTHRRTPCKTKPST